MVVLLDVTVMGISQMAYEAIQTADELQKEGINVEIVDPHTLKKLDNNIIFNSVKKKAGWLLQIQAEGTTSNFSGENHGYQTNR